MNKASTSERIASLWGASGVIHSAALKSIQISGGAILAREKTSAPRSSLSIGHIKITHNK